MDTLVASEFKALGTTCRFVASAEVARDVEEIVHAIVDDTDRTCSRFRPDSELQKVNAGGWTKISSSFLDYLDVALDAAANTHGLLDPTIGSDLIALGYDRSFEMLQPGGRSRLSIATPDYRDVEIDRDRMLVRLPRGLKLDFGATAKARSADLAASAASGLSGSSVLVSLGGDIAVGGPAPQGGWRVDIAEYHAATMIDHQILIESGGLATSTTTIRAWHQAETNRHHIIDPRTRESASVYWRTVTALAKNCVEANVATTTAIISGESAIDWLDANHIDAYLIHNDGWSTSVGRWPEEAL